MSYPESLWALVNDVLDESRTIDASDALTGWKVRRLLDHTSHCDE